MDVEGQSEGVNLLVNNEEGNAELPTEEEQLEEQYEEEEVDDEPIQNKLTPEQIIQL